MVPAGIVAFASVQVTMGVENGTVSSSIPLATFDRICPDRGSTNRSQHRMQQRADDG
jgi:hypothetical protein